MNKIKNSPLFFLEYAPSVTYATGEAVEHRTLDNHSVLSNELVVMVQKESGEKITFTSRSISYQDKIFIAPLPNPVHILLNSGIENYNHSVSKLNLLKNDCQLDNNADGIHILNIGIDNTNDTFNDLVKFKMMATISLVTSLEAFLNQMIPNDFQYEQTKNGSTKKLNKQKIESSLVTFKEKLTTVIDQLLKEPDFSNKNSKIITPIVELYNLRREIIHLKTNGQNEMGLYFKSIGRLLDIELGHVISTIKTYMNLVQPNFIE